MKEQLLSFVGTLNLDRRIISFDEAATKQAVVLRVLSLLGWDTFNIDEIIPEYSVGERRVDYSLKISNVSRVFIEVKKIGEDLEKHQEQLLNYAFQEGVKLAILTNGVTWWFYLPLHEGSWMQRKFYTIDILQQEPEDIVSKFMDFLSRENVASGTAIENAEAIYKGQQKQNILRETVPKAWNKVVSEADELLIELINETTEKICGYKADSEMIEQFLVEYKGQLIISITPPMKVTPLTTVKVGPLPQPSKPGNYTGKYISSFSFRGSQYEVRTWKDMLVRLCDILNAAHGNEFDKVLSLRGRKRPYFTHSENELRSPEKFSNTDIFLETNLSANQIVKICFDLLALFGYSSTDLRIEAY